MTRKKFSPEAFGERLRRELAGRDVKWFAQQLRDGTNVRGTSYGAVWAYVNGQAPADGPRPEVVQAMAKLLNVREDYLLYGGARTEYDRAIEGQFAVDPHTKAISAVRKVFREAFVLNSAAEQQLMRAWSASMNRESETARHGNLSFVDTENVDAVEVAEKLVRSLRAPLDEFGLYDSDTSSLAMDSYVVMACEALITMIAQDEPRLRDSRTVRVKHKEGNDA